jgi:ferredoxin
VTATLRIDWPACQRRGLCAEVLPEVLSLDEWGYPVVGAAVPTELIDLARDAAAACPHSALRLLRDR